ncbi:MAG: asparaginase, partial [Candidatus Competibacterales bacterium]|nr:asparaginase [Candidatus Competibacterales bacterium]
MIDPANPVLAEVWRGTLTESRHRGAIAVCDAGGRLHAAWGDVERPVYPRSAIKPLQALPLVESGALDAFGLGEAELALACASHSGETMHVEPVRDWLRRLGLGPDDLACGPQPPTHGPSRRALQRAGEAPGSLHNNCSGKHASFLTLARHRGDPVAGYEQPEHPVQQAWIGVLSELTGVDPQATGTDGCGIPVRALGLRATAQAMARLA